MRHPIAGNDAELSGRARHHFEHRAHRPAGVNQRLRMRYGILGDPVDAPVATDEDHVERDIGILHPEACRLLALEIEQHALSFRQLSPEHQSLRLLFRSDRHLDGKHMNTGLA